MNDEYPLIISDPCILNGKPVIAGTRISVEFVMELIASGSTIDEIAAQYPHVPVEGIRQAVLYAAKTTRNEIFINVKITA